MLESKNKINFYLPFVSLSSYSVLDYNKLFKLMIITCIICSFSLSIYDEFLWDCLQEFSECILGEFVS